MIKKRMVKLLMVSMIATSVIQVSANEASTKDYSKANSKTYKLGVVIANSGLNVRTSPEVDQGNKLFVIDKGAEVKILKEQNKWYKINLHNKEGWVSSEYIETKTKYLYVSATNLNFREAPSSSSAILDVLSKGDEVEFLSYDNEWVKINYNNEIGFVHSDYVKDKSQENNEDGEGASRESIHIQERVVSLAHDQLGKPYIWASEGPNSFDCSGLARYIYKNSANIILPRTAEEQADFGRTINKSELRPGDLIFSNTDGSGGVNHVGIYIGDGYVIHAPKPGTNVVKTNINSNYWNGVYLLSKRIIK